MRLAGYLLAGLLGMAVTSCNQPPSADNNDRPADSNEAPPNATADTLEELRRLYEEALEKAPDDPVSWAKEDLKKIGDWEYQIVELEKGDQSAIEARLNELGAERWEVFWVSEKMTRITFYLKKPARSYLRYVPISSIGGLLPTGDDGSE